MTGPEQLYIPNAIYIDYFKYLDGKETMIEPEGLEGENCLVRRKRRPDKRSAGCYAVEFLVNVEAIYEDVEVPSGFHTVAFDLAGLNAVKEKRHDGVSLFLVEPNGAIVDPTSAVDQPDEPVEIGYLLTAPPDHPLFGHRGKP